VKEDWEDLAAACGYMMKKRSSDPTQNTMCDRIGPSQLIPDVMVDRTRRRAGSNPTARTT